MSVLETIAATVIGAGIGEVVKNEINRHPQKLKHIVEDVDGMVARLKVKRKLFDNEMKRNDLSMPSEELNLWNEVLLKFQKDVKELKDEYKDRVDKYFHPLRRRTYKTEMLRMSSRAKELLETSRDFTVSQNTLFAPLPVEKLNNVPDIRGFPSLQIPLEEALRSLRHNRENRVIIICGTMGVGKTSVLQNLNNNEKVANLFDVVIFLKASAGKNEETLRQEIAQRLHLGDQRGTCAGSISNALKECKCLLLLDDVTKRLDLSQIGIPDNNAGSKVVLTSRSPCVCQSMSKVRMIKVKHLSRDEALKMFEEMVGNVIDLPGMRSLAHKVVEECNGLPFLIKAVASSFKWKENARLWRDAWSDLCCLDTKWGVEGVQEVYDFLSSCYDTMKKDETKRNCFFYVALFPASDKICANHLLESWTEEGFFNKLNQGAATYQAKLDRGYSVLDELIKVSLLNKDDTDKKMKCVYMHNIIQDFALYELSKLPGEKFLVNKGKSSLDPKKWEDAIRISLIDAKLERLPEIPDCRMLLTLLLQKNLALKTIPPSLFNRAKSVQLLDLHDTRVQSLSPSISNMTAMKALYLNACNSLQDLPGEIGHLKSLEVLDIRGTGIAFIPLPIADLVSLKILRMSYNYKQGVRIDNQVISRLVRLEELVIEVSSNNDWKYEVADVVKQVFVLEKLTNLRFCFPAPDTLQTPRLSTFRLFVGCPFRRSPQILQYLDFTVDRYLRYCHGELKNRERIRGVISQSQALELIDHKDITRLSDLEGEGGFQELEGLLINKCQKLVSIVDDTSRQIGKELPIPRQLYLDDLPCLKSVFEGNRHLGCLSRLEVLELKKCSVLTMVFSEEMIKQLTGLRELKIEDCDILEDLNMEPREEGLSSLKILRLHKLAKLKTISRDQSLTWPALEVLDIQKCPRLNNLTFNTGNAPQLSLIEGEKTWWDTSLDAEVKKILLRMCSLKLS